MMEKGMAIIGNLHAGIMPFMRTTYVQQPRLMQQPEERQKIDLMALISQVSDISEQSYKLTHHINNFREKVTKRRTYPRVVSGWVIKGFLRKRNGYSRISK